MSKSIILKPNSNYTFDSSGTTIEVKNDTKNKGYYLIDNVAPTKEINPGQKSSNDVALHPPVEVKNLTGTSLEFIRFWLLESFLLFYRIK